MGDLHRLLLMGPATRRGASYLFVGIVSASLIVMALGFLLGMTYQSRGVTLRNATREAQLGLDYFRGTLRLKNGGPPCGRACHQISDIGVPGGFIGPDLSDILNTVFEGDSTRVTLFLRNPTTPTMSYTWRRTPLIDDEVHDLVELLEYAAAHSDD